MKIELTRAEVKAVREVVDWEVRNKNGSDGRFAALRSAAKKLAEVLKV